MIFIKDGKNGLTYIMFYIRKKAHHTFLFSLTFYVCNLFEGKSISFKDYLFGLLLNIIK